MADPNGMVEALEEELAGAQAAGKKDRAKAIQEQLDYHRKNTPDEPGGETPAPAHQKQLAAGGANPPERPGLSATTEEWRAYASHPTIALDVPEDAGRDAIVAAYIEKNTPALNASTEEWAVFAKDHGVDPEGKNRDELVSAIGETGWAKKSESPADANTGPKRTTQQNKPQQTRGN